VREPLSARYLKELGIDSVVTTIDTAFYDEPDRQENEKKFREQTKLVKFFAEHERVVGVTLSDFSWNVEYMNKEELPERLKKTFQAFVKKINAEHYGILLIPQLFGNQNDSEYLTQFESEDTFLLSDEWDTYFQQYIISKCYSLVGMRYHSNIFAAKMGVPFVAIGYEEKMYGFMEEHGLTDYLIKIDDLCEKSLLEKWTKLVDTYPKYRDVLLCKRESWRELAAQTIQCVLDVVC
jgi:colanic acid/amylovoran biosynthesis protein